MKYVILGVHGLNNKPETDILSKDWRRAICEGLEINANIDLGIDDLNFHMCDWASVFHPQRETVSAYRKVVDREHIKRHKDKWWEHAAAAFGDTVDAVPDYLKRKGLLTDIADTTLKEGLKDLHGYYTDSSKKQECREIVKHALNNHAAQKIIVVSHSMGTIISYDAMRIIGNESDDVGVEHFITMGSPLGLPHVKNEIHKEFKSLRSPSIIKRWTNFSDRRDPVCFDTHLRGDYSKNRDGVRAEDDRVLNDWGIAIGQNPLWKYHKSYGYLRTPEFSELIAEYI
jgi:hypothetical protein